MKVIPASEFENYVGQETGVTEWIEITQERIDLEEIARTKRQSLRIKISIICIWVEGLLKSIAS